MHFSRNNLIHFSLYLFLILYPWYMVISGIDMTDTGFWLTYYKNFWNDPASMIKIFPTWLSVVIASSINSMFNEIGLFGFKAMHIMLIYLSLILVYKMLKPYTSKTLLLLSLSVTIVFVNIDLGTIINHNNLTAFFYLLAIYFLYFGLIDNNRKYFLFSGVILGLNIFIRFPNLLGIGFLLPILYYDFITHKPLKESFKKSLLLVSGYLVSILFTLTVMKAIGQLELYGQGLHGLMHTAKESSNTHNLFFMLNNFLKDQLSAFGYGTVFALGIIFIGWISNLWNHSQKLSWLLAFILSCITVFIIMLVSHILSQPTYYFIHKGIIGLFYIILIFITLKNARTSPAFSLLALIAFLLIEILPLGSDTHLRKYVRGMYFGLPIILVWLYNLSSLQLGLFSLGKNRVFFLKKYISVTLVLFSIIVSTFYFAAYGDNRAKFSMTATVDHPLLKYNLTTQTRADTLTELLNVLPKYTIHYNYMLTFGRIPLVQYLSSTKPYIDNPNPLYETPLTLEKKLLKAQKEKDLPLVITAKTQTNAKSWPTEREKIPLTNKRYKQQNTIIKNFLKKHNYVKVWENDDFIIFTPRTKPKNNHK